MVPGRRFSTSTSDRCASLRKTSLPRGALRSSASERLLRFSRMKLEDSPSMNGPLARVWSPPSGFSILTTSAPRSASCSVQNGAAMKLPTSSTRIPASAASAIRASAADLYCRPCPCPAKKRCGWSALHTTGPGRSASASRWRWSTRGASYRRSRAWTARRPSRRRSRRPRRWARRSGTGTGPRWRRSTRSGPVCSTPSPRWSASPSSRASGRRWSGGMEPCSARSASRAPSPSRTSTARKRGSRRSPSNLRVRAQARRVTVRPPRWRAALGRPARRKDPHPRFRVAVHAAHRPARAGAARLLRDPPLHDAHRADPRLRAPGHHPLRQPVQRGAARRPVGGSRGLRDGRPGAGGLLRPAADGQAARRSHRPHRPPRIRTRARRGDRASGALPRDAPRGAPRRLDEPRRQGLFPAARLPRHRAQRELAVLRGRQSGEAAVRHPVPPRSGPHPPRPRAVRGVPRGVRRQLQLPHGRVHRGRDGPHPRAGGKGAGHLRPLRRSGQRGGGAAPPPRHRPAAPVHLRRQRPAARGRGRAGAADVRRPLPPAAAHGRRAGPLPREAARRDRSRAQAQDHRQRVHRRLRGGGGARSGRARRRAVPRPGDALPGRDRERLLQGPQPGDQEPPQRGRAAGADAHAADRAAPGAVQGRGARAGARAGPARGDRRAPALPWAGPRHPGARRGHRGPAAARAQSRRHRAGGGRQRRPAGAALAGVRGAPAGAQRGGNGRRAHLRVGLRAARGGEPRRDDRGLGAPPVRPGGDDLRAHHQRGARHQPGRLRRVLQAARHHRVGVERLRLVRLASLLLVAAAARASSVSDEITIAGTQSTPQNPRAGSVSNLLSASVDVGESWTVNASAQVTVEAPTPAPAGAFPDRGGTVTDFSGGVDWDADDNWTFGITLDVSPESTIGSDARLRGQNPIDVLVQSTSSIASLETLAGYDTAGSSDLEWSFTAGVALSRLETRQHADATHEDGTSVSPAELRTRCTPVGSGCRALLPAIDGLSGVLRYARVSAGALATVRRDTDVGVSLDYYGYADDPANVGLYTTATTGRFGTSAPIAPLRYLVRPSLTHRFGAFSLKAWGQAGRYVSEAGQGTAALGAKAQYRFSRFFRMWISATGQRDEDPSGAISRTGILTLGAGYRF